MFFTKETDQKYMDVAKDFWRQFFAQYTLIVIFTTRNQTQVFG